MILNPYNDIRWAGNEAAHIASNAEKSAAIMSDDLPTWTREHLRNIYIYAYERLPLQISWHILHVTTFFAYTFNLICRNTW